MGRSSIAVSDEIAAELNRLAVRDKRTSYALANECLGVALKICDQGGEPGEIYGAWIMNRIGKDIGAFQWIGRNLMERFVSEFGHLEPEKFSRSWREAGYNFGVYLQICFPSIEDVLGLVAQLKQSFNIGRVELLERTSTPRENHVFSLSIVTSFSAELLTYLAEYWRGLLSAYGLEVSESNIAMGAVRLLFASHGKLMKAEPQLVK
jgi:hypothetical protein